MIEHKKIGHFPGDWIYVFEVATESESTEFTKYITKLETYKEIIDEVKKNNPEALI